MKTARKTPKLSHAQRDALLETLRQRFEQHPKRHAGLAWADVASRLETHPEKLWSLQQMEQSGGEPDVIGRAPATDEYLFCDCAPQSPAERMSLCYDAEALASRQKFKPKDSACAVAASWGIELLTEEQYFALQRLGEFDTKTSSWLNTPADIRERGGALFGDRRFGRVFVYHNGAESYFSGRGFRGVLRV